MYYQNIDWFSYREKKSVNLLQLFTFPSLQNWLIKKAVSMQELSFINLKFQIFEYRQNVCLTHTTRTNFPDRIELQAERSPGLHRWVSISAACTLVHWGPNIVLLVVQRWLWRVLSVRLTTRRQTFTEWLFQFNRYGVQKARSKWR